MEQSKVTFPENTCEMAEELAVDFFDLLLSLLLAASFHELIDVVARFVSVSPLAEAERKLELLFPDGQDLGHLLVIVKFDWVGDSAR